MIHHLSRALSSERHWFVFGLFALMVAGGFYLFTRSQPRAELHTLTAVGHGAIAVETDPTGATVELEGQRYTTPIKVDGLVEGSHTLKITFEDTTPVEKSVIIHPPSTTYLFLAP